MLSSYQRLTGALLGMALTLACATPALADDTEIYSNSSLTSPDIRPNILLIVDTSGSMTTKDAENERDPYVAATGYTERNNCTSGRIFFRRSGEALPDCNSTDFIIATSNKCVALAAAVAGSSGRWIGKAAQYDETTQTWSALAPSGTVDPVECFADSGKDGETSGSAAKYAQNGDKNNKWTDTAARVIDWNQITTYNFYSANWMNWHSQAANKTISRIDSVRTAVVGLASSVDGVNLGLMRYNDNNGKNDETAAQGGYIAQAVQDVSANRQKIIDTVNSFDADGWTPLSETLYEAGQYFAGGAVRFGGANAAPGPDDDTARTGNTYKSPIEEQCQRNYIVYLTDGLPTQDNEADDAISTLAHGNPGMCTVDSTLDPAQKAADDGICLDDMAGYLHNTNLPGYLQNTDLSSTLDDAQTVTTYTIGFGKEVKGLKFLDRVAEAGGGKRFDAANSEQLSEVLTNIANDALNSSTTFSTASVGVDAFNRAQTRDELYFGMFSPDDTLRWDGNLKKYKLVVDETTDPKSLVIAGQDMKTNVIDPKNGAFKKEAQSFWSTAADGNDARAGGAASKLPAARTIYTFFGNNPAGETANGALVPLSTATATDFGATTTADELAATLDFAYTKSVKRMGDPLHSAPTVVTYGGTTAMPNDIVYLATNDGYLHAVDPSTGIEKWAFVPKELLPRLKQLRANPTVVSRTYGLDGDIVILRLDKKEDGVIDRDDGDRVWLYVGMRRGGRSYYALDVTDPARPALMWADDATVLPGLGETWSPPVITRVNVQGATQNNQKLTLIFGGGYDGAQENGPQVDDTTGNHIFMVDAKSGALLWYAASTTDTAGTSDQQGFRKTFADMKNSFPARISVIDTDGDLFADRLYAGDMGGRVWRFDIFNGKSVGDLVTGGVFAELGQGQVVPPAPTSIADTRRFYNAPDVTLIQRRGADPYYNIAIGSGYRGHPLKTETIDRFYSLRDKQPFTKLTQELADKQPRLQDASLVDITADPINSAVNADSNGWKYAFSARSGEKVLSEATTVNGVILVSTYQPDSSAVKVSCRPKSANRVYAFKADNGKPALNLNNDNALNNQDLYTDVLHEGILGSVNVGLLRGELAKKLGSDTPGPPTVCVAGMHILGQCVPVNGTVRTYWRRDADGE
jgi:type IV pilus assembly protein PilY1